MKNQNMGVNNDSALARFLDIGCYILSGTAIVILIFVALLLMEWVTV